ncbi:MAG: NUDIX domain-containing protein [archaeon]
MGEKPLSELAPRDAQLGSAVILKHSGKLVFAVDKPKRWRTEKGRTIVTFSGIGGAVELDEGFPAAAVRECIEESGAKPELESAKRTLFVDYDNSVRDVRVSDELKPAVIYRRLYLSGAESWQLFCPAYLARAHSPPRPADLPALLFLTLSDFRELKNPTRLRNLLLKGASHIVEGPGKIPREAYLAPFGLSEALFAIDGSRAFSLAKLLRNQS